MPRARAHSQVQSFVRSAPNEHSEMYKYYMYNFRHAGAHGGTKLFIPHSVANYNVIILNGDRMSAVAATWLWPTITQSCTHTHTHMFNVISPTFHPFRTDPLRGLHIGAGRMRRTVRCGRPDGRRAAARPRAAAADAGGHIRWRVSLVTRRRRLRRRPRRQR